MELNAIYENGRLYFDGAFKLKMKRVPVRVVVDDEAVMNVDTGDKPSNSVEGKASFLLQKIHSLLGADYEYIPTNKTDKEMLFEALEEKYLR
jgi:hypothetical protein